MKIFKNKKLFIELFYFNFIHCTDKNKIQKQYENIDSYHRCKRFIEENTSENNNEFVNDNLKNYKKRKNNFIELNDDMKNLINNVSNTNHRVTHCSPLIISKLRKKIENSLLNKIEKSKSCNVLLSDYLENHKNIILTREDQIVMFFKITHLILKENKIFYSIFKKICISNDSIRNLTVDNEKAFANFEKYLQEFLILSNPIKKSNYLNSLILSAQKEINDLKNCDSMNYNLKKIRDANKNLLMLKLRQNIGENQQFATDTALFSSLITFKCSENEKYEMKKKFDLFLYFLNNFSIKFASDFYNVKPIMKDPFTNDENFYCEDQENFLFYFLCKWICVFSNLYDTIEKSRLNINTSISDILSNDSYFNLITIFYSLHKLDFVKDIESEQFASLWKTHIVNVFNKETLSYFSGIKNTYFKINTEIGNEEEIKEEVMYLINIILEILDKSYEKVKSSIN